jgi:hypothetical protein
VQAQFLGKFIKNEIEKTSKVYFLLVSYICRRGLHPSYTTHPDKIFKKIENIIAVSLPALITSILERFRMKVEKVANIVRGEILLIGKWKNHNLKNNDYHIPSMITNIESPDNPDMTVAWYVRINVGDGPFMRTATLDIPPLLSSLTANDCPTILGPVGCSPLIYFQNSLFVSERVIGSIEEEKEVFLRIKKITYEEQLELSGLRATVANLEAIIEFPKSGQRREPIPESVKLLVWTRDSGSCVQCGSKKNIHFDHIIPVAKGGGNIEANIQILCQICNLRKSDKIASI